MTSIRSKVGCENNIIVFNLNSELCSQILLKCSDEIFSLIEIEVPARRNPGEIIECRKRMLVTFVSHDTSKKLRLTCRLSCSPQNSTPIPSFEFFDQLEYNTRDTEVTFYFFATINFISASSGPKLTTRKNTDYFTSSLRVVMSPENEIIHESFVFSVVSLVPYCPPSAHIISHTLIISS